MRSKKFFFLICMFAMVVSCCFAARVDGKVSNPINSIATIIYDMTPPHEGMPHGVPTSLNWASGPRVGMGNNPNGFKAMIAWGQLYEDATGNPATNTRVQLRHIKAFILSKRDGKWYRLQSSKKVYGASYREDYAGDINQPADIRYHQNGTVSVKLDKGYNFHFWCDNGRASIDPKDIAGIFTTVQARLITDNHQQPADLSKARYLLSMGGDYWLNLTAKWDNWTTNSDIGIGKFKYVRTRWQSFNMTTLSPTEILHNPPPL